MPSFTSNHTVNHKADDMFRLVADVEKYPQFVPLCQGLHVRGRKELENGNTVLVADMTVAYKLFKETFTSRVELRPEERTILVEYLDGPFKHLENTWTFEDTGEGRSKVGFFISYEFRSRTLGSLMGVMFDKAFRKFSNAFEARADQVYGA
ncbi:type II toxin-antitoxin system RatA family toxin [uncultured Roseibium sp.]|uniref:type II toxin-antitoxin system RatA family toxin n=1 Tax=uncultured Roseibium sp. TaxID=1936171 RepID=UPI00262E0898|nr:type II toxin-antitoxin system RatA family toxin [uncultured Roseibium sp.]